MKKNQNHQIQGDKNSIRTTTGIILLVLFFGLVCSSVSGTDTSPDPFYENTIAAQHIQVVNSTLNPSILMPGDLATVTILLQNTGTEKGVGITSAVLNSKDIRVLSDNYGNVGSIGPTNSMPLTFTLQAGNKTGIFYPVFSTEFRGTYFLKYPFKVEVQDIPLDVFVYEKPDSWADDKKEVISLHIGNRRDNPVTGVIIIPSPGSYEVYPSSEIIGNLEPGETREVVFNVTPHGEGPVNFTVQYKNGINLHEVTCSLPLTFGKNKKQADLFISNVDISNVGEYIKVKGDVSNSGIETANGVTVSSKDPADPVYPNKEYLVGLLKASEFSQFEVTFQIPPGVSEVPIVTSFKDLDGQTIAKETLVNVSVALLAMNSTETGIPMEEPGTLFGIPQNYILIAGVVLILLIGYFVSRRRLRKLPVGKVKRLRTTQSSEQITSLPTGSAQGSGVLPDENQSKFREGMSLYQQGEYKKAAELFHQIVEENRMNHRAWNGYGICLTRLGENQAAQDCYENALMLEPGNASYERNKEKNERKIQKL